MRDVVDIALSRLPDFASPSASTAGPKRTRKRQDKGEDEPEEPAQKRTRTVEKEKEEDEVAQASTSTRTRKLSMKAKAISESASTRGMKKTVPKKEEGNGSKKAKKEKGEGSKVFDGVMLDKAPSASKGKSDVETKPEEEDVDAEGEEDLEHTAAEISGPSNRYICPFTH